jgi:hypothetical protein
MSPLSRGLLPAVFVGLLGTGCALSTSSGELIGQALEAQLGGPGACEPITRRDTAASSFFPGVRLVIGSCEHAGTKAVALVGVDRSGVIYLLGTRTGFNFLLTRHSPRGLDSATAIEFALDALTMSGQVEPGAALLSTVNDLPADVATAMRRSGVAFSPTRMLEVRPDAWVVSLTTLSERRVANYWVSVGRDSGVFRASGSTLWRRAGG